MARKEIIGRVACDCCGDMNPITEDDLGYEELECRTCNNYIQVPDSVEKLEEHNNTALAEMRARDDRMARYRIVVTQEEGTPMIVATDLPNDDKLQILKAGYRDRYPEARNVEIEREPTSVPNWALKLERGFDDFDGYELD